MPDTLSGTISNMAHGFAAKYLDNYNPDIPPTTQLAQKLGIDDIKNMPTGDRNDLRDLFTAVIEDAKTSGHIVKQFGKAAWDAWKGKGMSQEDIQKYEEMRAKLKHFQDEETQ